MSGRVRFVLSIALVADWLVILSPSAYVWALVLCLYGAIALRSYARARGRTTSPAWKTAWALLWLGIGVVGVISLLWKEWPSAAQGVGYGTGFALGIAIGAAAALVRVAIFYTRFRPPVGWVTSMIRMPLYLLPGAVIAGILAGAGPGLLLWVGSVGGGTISLFFPYYLPPDLGERLNDRQKQEEALISASESLRRDGNEAAPALIGSPHARVRGYAINTALRRGWRDAQPVVLRRLEAEVDPEVRQAIARALAEWADASSHEALRGLLEDSDSLVQRLALRGLSRLGDPGVIDPARAMYATGGYFNRLEAVGALQQLGTSEADDALRQLIADEPSRRRRRQARAAVRRGRKRSARRERRKS